MRPSDADAHVSHVLRDLADLQGERLMDNIIEGDCRVELGNFSSNTVHMVLTDPPYFLDGFDDRWRKGTSHTQGSGAFASFPVGMRYSPRQGHDLQKFIEPLAMELYRVLRPGGFLLMFSSPRLYHRMAVAVEDAGFEIRDQYVWRFTRQALFKAFSMDHFVRRRKNTSVAEQNAIIEVLDGRKTPQLKPEFESILCAQKPRDGTFVDNWLEHRVGLIDVTQTLTGKVPTTVMTVEKPKKTPDHPTPKPVELFAHLIRLFTTKGQAVVDPFLGSGTTLVAAALTGRQGVGIEINPDYIDVARRRLEKIYEQDLQANGWRDVYPNE